MSAQDDLNRTIEWFKHVIIEAPRKERAMSSEQMQKGERGKEGTLGRPADHAATVEEWVRSRAHPLNGPVERQEKQAAGRSSLDALVALADRATHPEATCDECGGPNFVWSAPNELWNATVGTSDNPRGEGIILCPTCFARRLADRATELEALLGGEKPSDEAVRYFQRLHGLPEDGAPADDLPMGGAIIARLKAAEARATELERQREAWEADLEHQWQQREYWRERAERAETALRYYADPSSWRQLETMGTSSANLDRGMKARAALGETARSEGQA